MQTQNGYLPLATFLFCFLITGNVYSQSKYLDSIELEAQSLNLDKSTEIPVEELEKKGTIKVPLSQTGGAITQLSPGLTVEQFETVLKQNYIGSFLFYKRLKNNLKDQVYQYYQANPDSKLIREKILKLNKK